MANTINELGLFVAFQKSPIASLHDTGLMVLHNAAVPAPEARLRQVGMMVLFEAIPMPGGDDPMQGERLRSSLAMQGTRIRDAKVQGRRRR